MIAITTVVKVSPEKQKEFVQTVLSLQKEGRKIQCIRDANLYQDVRDHSRFSVIEELDSHEDLTNYLRGENFMILRGAIEVLCEKSEIRCSTYKGIQY